MFLSNSSIFADLPMFRDTGSQCVAVRLLAYTFLQEDAVGSSGADGSEKRFLACYISSVCQAAGQNRGKAFQMNSEQLKDNWERGIIKCCLLSQDHENLWYLLSPVIIKNPIRLAEFHAMRMNLSV